MTHSAVQFTGMPYVPGSTRGFLQRDLSAATSSDIVILSQRDIDPLAMRPAGYIVVSGAPLSHTLIGLLEAGIPTVIVSEQQAERLETGREVILDGSTGLITSDIETAAVRSSSPTAPAAGQPVLTADGVAVHLRASVRSVAAAGRAVTAGAEAIGLVRSEFLQPGDGVLPDVAFYQHAFSEICAAAAPLSVTIRLLDLAVDKMPGWMPSASTGGGALGLQGARLFDRQPVQAVFHAQLAALDTLSDGFDVHLLIPYLSRYEELRYWVEYIRRQVSKPLPIGAMAETPASALDVANWLDSADFIAVGCNDLMQCLFAADRDQPELSTYLDPYAPLLYRFLAQVAEGLGANLQRIQLCGVLPQLLGVLPILLGLGYRAFSVDVAHLPFLAQVIQATSITEAQSLAAGVCAAKESRQVTGKLGLNS
jgi:phosphoenolpyruvate-protein kinase (PTS system EI component)